MLFSNAELCFVFCCYLGALLLEEFGVDLLADDLGADVILDSNAKPHLF